MFLFLVRAKRLSIYYCYLFLLISGIGFSQAGFTKEQLYHVLNKPQPDTVLIDTYTELCWPIFSYDDLDSAVYFGNKAIELSEKIKDIKRLSVIHRRIGIGYINFSKYKEALFHQEMSYNLSEKINFKKGMQLALNNTGVVYLNNQLYNKALTYFLRSLKIVEETKDYKSASNMLINCGLIYSNIRNDEKALEYYLKANENAKKQKDIYSIVMSYCDLSVIYRHKKQLDLAILYLDRAKNELKNLNNNHLVFNVKLNEALIFSDKKEHIKSLNIILNLFPLLTNNTDKITVLINIGDEYKKINKLDSAQFYYEKAYEMCKNNRMYINAQYLTHEIALLFAKKQNLKYYSEFMERHLACIDSNEMLNKSQNILSQQLEYDFAKKQIADSISYAHKEQIYSAKLETLNAKSKIDKLIRVALIVFVLIIAFVAFFIYSRLRLTSKQNKIIEQQKILVEEKQKEILASINYAKRIQTAILPQEKFIERKLNEHKKN